MPPQHFLVVVVALDRGPAPDLLAHLNVDPDGRSVLVLQSEPIEVLFHELEVFSVLLIAPIVVLSPVSSMRGSFVVFPAEGGFGGRGLGVVGFLAI